MLDLIISTLTQGFIYAMLSYGIYITYKILDFPDLTVDGSFPLGAAVTALLLVKGVNPYLTLLAALASGAAAGFVTGFIHVRLKVRDLLAGIITMTALFSVNLQIAGSNLSVARSIDTIFTAAPTMAGFSPAPWATPMATGAMAAMVPMEVPMAVEMKQHIKNTPGINSDTGMKCSARLMTDSLPPIEAAAP